MLHVQESEVKRVEEIFSQLDENANTKVDEDFRDADLGDIAYERSITEFDENIAQEKGKYGLIAFVIAALILAAIVAFFMSPKEVRNPNGMRINLDLNSVN